MVDNRPMALNKTANTPPFVRVRLQITAEGPFTYRAHTVITVHCRPEIAPVTEPAVPVTVTKFRPNFTVFPTLSDERRAVTGT